MNEKMICFYCVRPDIQVKEPTPDSLTKKQKSYLPPRFMSVSEAAKQLLTLVQNGKTRGK